MLNVMKPRIRKATLTAYAYKAKVWADEKYAWIADPARKNYVASGIMLTSAVASAYLVGRMNGHHSMMNEQSLIKTISSGLHPGFVFYVVGPLAQRAKTDAVAQLTLQGLNLAYNALEGIAYAYSGSTHLALTMIPSLGISALTTGATAHFMRREQTIPQQLWQLYKGTVRKLTRKQPTPKLEALLHDATINRMD